MLEYRRQLLQEDVYSTLSHVGAVVFALTHFSTPDQARDQIVARHVEIYRSTYGAAMLSEPIVQELCLRKGARKAIQDRAVRGIGLLQAPENSFSHNVIRQQVTALHQLGSLSVESQQIAARDVRYPESFAQQVGLGALTGTWSAEQKDELWLRWHSFVPHTRFLSI
jgi:hypothetical protein